MNKIIIGSTIGLTFIAWFFWGNSAALSVDNKYEFSNNDIDNLYDTEMELAKIVGSSVVANKNDVLYNLAITTMQKIILEKNNIKLLDREKSIKLVEENNNFKGFYKKIKKKLGDNDYYRLLIEPIVISKTFISLYQKSEPAKNNALKVLALTKDKNLMEVAKLTKQKILQFDFNKKKQKNIIKNLIKLKGKSNLVYNSLVKVGDNWTILEFKSEDKELIKVNALAFKIMTYKIFLSKLLKGIKLEFPMLSKYNIKDIYNKKGNIIQ